jgi:CBS domain-containing protein
MPKAPAKSVAVSQYMQRKPVTVTADMNIYEASQRILEHKISGVLVVDKDNKLVGMLSEVDCLRALVTSVYNGSDPGGALVGDIMTAEVEVNGPNDDIISVAASMLDKHHRRRPVVLDGKLVGQVTCRQILGAFKDFNGTN